MSTLIRSIISVFHFGSPDASPLAFDALFLIRPFLIYQILSLVIIVGEIKRLSLMITSFVLVEKTNRFFFIHQLSVIESFFFCVSSRDLLESAE